MRLSKGKIVEVKLQRGSFMLRCWEYQINDIRVGIIFKQLYPKQGIIYRMTPTLHITRLWFEDPQSELHCHKDSEWYNSKKEALRGLKSSLKFKLRILDKLKQTP